MKFDRTWPALALLLALAACARDFPPTPTRPPATDTPAPEPQVVPAVTPSPTSPPYPWTDASAVVAGICFESAADAAGHTFVIRSADELSHFFDLADHSELCRQPVERGEFDFSSGRILAGTWSRGTGCTARHVVDRVVRDDTARTFFIFLRLVTDGDCAYELARPFWIGLAGLTDYEVQFVVE